jgi:lipopolysaccharide transport system ATP-binding protein
MSDIAIKFENVSKQYKLGTIGTGTLSHDLNRWWTVRLRGKEDQYTRIGSLENQNTIDEYDYVWALKNINIEVKVGEVLGIIGKNGAGKSTLLKLLSRVTAPTTGIIYVRGRIASLLEVGTGFHPEMTGRENIYMNGSIMGMTKAEITRKFDEIVDFAGIEKFIDTPVKRYSSGMTVRLGFAIAAHLEPEILVVDEVLAVGDAEFQQKAIGKMKSVSQSTGRTVLFVSHNMGAVRNLCQNGIILSNGEIIFKDLANNTVSHYINLKQKGSIYYADKNNDLFIRKATPVKVDLSETNGYDVNEKPRLLIEIVNNKKIEFIKNIVLGIALLDDTKNKIFTVEYDLNQFLNSRQLQSVKLLIEFPARLIAPGNYSFHIAIHKPNVELFDVADDICYFQIVEDGSVGYFKYPGVKQGCIIVDSSCKIL